jgi:hypothetical protein
MPRSTGKSFREDGRWFCYVPRAHVSLFAVCGWREMPAADPPDWSVLMRWTGAGEPGEPQGVRGCVVVPCGS